MKNKDNEAVAQLLLATIGNELEVELSNATDSGVALQKALMFLIYLTQSDANPPAAKFIQFLLERFPALNKYADQRYYYPFLNGHNMNVVLAEEGQLQATIHTSFFEDFDKLMDEDKLVGEKLSREFYDQVKVYLDKKDDKINFN